MKLSKLGVGAGWLSLLPVIVFISMATGLVTAYAAGPTGSTTLSNGAALSVSIDAPASGVVIHLAPGVATASVPISGQASVGKGEPDATLIYVMDVSGSTGGGGGTDCSPILTCEKQFFVGLNNAAIADGSVDLVSLVTFSTTATAALGLTDPTAGAVNAAINGATAGGGTNCATGLTNATAVATGGANTNGTTIVVFASDGVCADPGSVPTEANALGATGAVVHSVAVGTGTSCNPSMLAIRQNGGTCTQVVDPGDLPDIIQNLIGSSLDELRIKVDAGGFSAISNAEIDPDLPAPGAVTATYGTTVTGLAPGAHTICVDARGSDVLGDSEIVQGCVVVQVVQLGATPPTATNNLGGGDNTHTVTATIAGDPTERAGKLITFTVTGQNAGAAGVCAPVTCLTNAAGTVTFTYTVPFATASVGSDTISVSTTLGTVSSSGTVTVSKRWQDTTAPTASCIETTNPAGNNTPKAGQGAGSSGQNPDGFYQLLGGDVVGVQSIVVADTGSSFVSNPFASGDKLKITQAPGATPSDSRPGPGVLMSQLKLKGDAILRVTDTSGNVTEVTCRVAPPPK